MSRWYWVDRVIFWVRRRMRWPLEYPCDVCWGDRYDADTDLCERCEREYHGW